MKKVTFNVSRPQMFVFWRPVVVVVVVVVVPVTAGGPLNSKAFQQMLAAVAFGLHTRR